MKHMGRKYTFGRHALIVAGFTIAFVNNLTSSLLAQTEGTYHGSCELATYQGEASYEYLLQGADTVLNGPFEMRGTDLDAFLNDESNYFSFQGNYRNNIPDNRWKIEFGKFSASRQASFADYYFRLGTNGVHHLAEGQIKEGKLDGTWNHTIYQIRSSARERQEFKSEIIFEQGVPQRAFQIENDSFTLLGRLLRTGQAHDTWSLYAGADPIEEWNFVDGRLTSITSPTGSGRSIQIPSDAAGQTSTIDLDLRYLKYLSLAGKLSGSDRDILTSPAARLLRQNSDYYEKINSVLSARSETDFRPGFKVTVPLRTLSKDENVHFAQSGYYLDKIDSIADHMATNSSFSIGKLASDEVQFLLTAAQAIQEDFVAPVRQMHTAYQDSIIEFFDRQKLWQHYWPEEQVSGALTIASDETDTAFTRIFAGPGLHDFNPQQNGSEDLLGIARYAYLSIDSVRNTLERQLLNKQRFEIQAQLEDQLVQEIQQLNAFTDTLDQTIVSKYHLVDLREFAKSQLREYSEIKDAAEKLNQAQLLLGCLKNVNHLAITLAELPSKWQEIQKIYTDEVWNNFTATVMSEEIKKRITNSYRDVIIPHLIDASTKNLTCGAAPEKIELFAALHQRMLDLRTEETSRIERKLKNETDPALTMQLLAISEPSPRQ